MSGTPVQIINRTKIVVKCLKCKSLHHLTDVEIRMEPVFDADNPGEFVSYAVSFHWATPGQIPDEDNIAYLEDLLCQDYLADDSRARRCSIYGETDDGAKFAFPCLVYVHDMDPTLPRDLWASHPDRKGTHFAVRGPGK